MCIDLFFDYYDPRLTIIKVMRITYGIQVQENEDPFVSLIEHANDNFSIATKAGQFLVDVFPLLRLVPEWFPGAGFKRLAHAWRKDMEAMVEVPYAETRSQMVTIMCITHFLYYAEHSLGSRDSPAVICVYPTRARGQADASGNQRYQIHS